MKIKFPNVLLAACGLILTLSTSVSAQVGDPLDWNEYLREDVVVTKNRRMEVTCLGSSGPDVILTTFENSAVNVELNGKLTSVPIASGVTVDLKVIGFEGDDDLNTIEIGNALTYRIGLVQMHGREDDDNLYCDATALTIMSGGQGIDDLKSNCLLEVLSGDDLRETTAGVEIAADLEIDNVYGRGTFTFFTQTAVPTTTPAGTTWDLRSSDINNEDPLDPSDVLTFFAEPTSLLDWFTVIDDTQNEVWWKAAPY